MENVDISQFGHAAETAANAYMLETVAGVIFGGIALLFFIKIWNDMK